MSRYLPICAGVLLVGFLSGDVTSAQDDTEVVIVRGVGDSEKAARADAIRAAMEKVVGAYVEAKTLVENDRVIYDRVLQFTGGEIQNSELLKREQRAGQTIVWLRVEVRADTLKKRLRDNNVTVDEKRAQAIRRFFAGLEPQGEKGDIAELIREYHLAAVWKAEFIGNPNRPTITKLSDGTAKVALAFKLRPDGKEWFKYRDRLTAALSKLSQPVPSYDYQSSFQLIATSPDCAVDLRGDGWHWLAGFHPTRRNPWYERHSPTGGERGIAIAVLTGGQIVDPAGDNRGKFDMNWSLYRVPKGKAHAEELRELMKAEVKANVRLALVDKNDAPVKQATIPLDQACHQQNIARGPLSQGYWGTVDLNTTQGMARDEVFLVSPLLWRYLQDPHAFVIAPQPYRTEFTLTQQEAERITRVVLHVEKAR